MREYQLSRNWASQISEPLKVPDSLTKIIEEKTCQLIEKRAKSILKHQRKKILFNIFLAVKLQQSVVLQNETRNKVSWSSN